MHGKRHLAMFGIRVCFGLLLGAAAGSSAAHIVALDIDLPLDRIGAGRPFKAGTHHHARVFYDDAKIDPKTHIVRVLHMQHLVDPWGWVPARLDAVAMPMTDAWLDLGERPYRYHYRSAVVERGEPVLVDFDEKTRRMSVRLQSDRSLIVSAPYVVGTAPVAGLQPQTVFLRPPAYLMLAMDVAIDQAAAGEHESVGSHDRLRLVFDASEIDAATQRVPLLNLQHFMRGGYLPGHPDAVMMPTDDAWLELGREPYALHFRAKVIHGKPILIEADERSHRLTIRPQADPHAVLVSGHYSIDPRPISGPEATAAATASAGAPTAWAGAPTPPAAMQAPGASTQ
jgi:hypothetical protein